MSQVITSTTALPVTVVCAGVWTLIRAVVIASTSVGLLVNLGWQGELPPQQLILMDTMSSVVDFDTLP